MGKLLCFLNIFFDMKALNKHKFPKTIVDRAWMLGNNPYHRDANEIIGSKLIRVVKRVSCHIKFLFCQSAFASTFWSVL